MFGVLADTNSPRVLISFCIFLKLLHRSHHLSHFMCAVQSHQLQPHCRTAGTISPQDFLFHLHWNSVLIQQPAPAPSLFSLATTIYFQDLTTLDSTGKWTHVAFVPPCLAYFIKVHKFLPSVQGSLLFKAEHCSVGCIGHILFLVREWLSCFFRGLLWMMLL